MTRIKIVIVIEEKDSEMVDVVYNHLWNEACKMTDVKSAHIEQVFEENNE